MIASCREPVKGGRWPPFFSAARARGGGFTYVELIAVLVIAGILAAVALPRFFSASAFEARGYFEEMVSAVRYARQLAVARSCPVRVTFPGGGYRLREPDLFCAANFDAVVAHPARGGAFENLDAPAPVTAPAAITFSADGSAGGDATIGIAGHTALVHGATGYLEVQ